MSPTEAPATTAPDHVLEVRDVRVRFGRTVAVDGVSLKVRPHETLGLVGESGCGKTTLARAILGLQPLADGEIRVGGKAVKGLERGQAARIGMVWQDPYASLDPRWTVGRSLREPADLVGRAVPLEALMNEVGLDPSLQNRFPHQLSGGQRQRVAIGRALALRPPLLLCDEPTAALDLSIQAQILNLLQDVQAAMGCAILYISHDLATVRFLADRIAVMYLGQIVEEGPTEEIFRSPRHPYTRTLLDAVPDPRRPGHLPPVNRGEASDGSASVGCRYAPRCPVRQATCDTVVPAVSSEASGATERNYRCHFPLKVP